ncbi:MAG: tetratricopeptide repeat protein [Bacteroidota bacterium]
MRRPVLLLFTLNLFFMVARGQNADSLKALLNGNDIADTSRILVLVDLSYEMRRIQPDSSLALANEALALAERLKYYKGKGRAMRMMGIQHYLKGNYQEAFRWYQQALAFSEQTADWKNIANCYNNLGNIHQSQSNYKQAIEHFERSLAIRQRISDQVGVAQCYGNIGSVYDDQGKFQDALKFFLKGLAESRKTGNKEGVASSYNNIGSAHKSLGHYEQALEYFYYALEVRKERGDKPAIAFSYNNIGNVYRDQGNYEKALEYFFDALKLHEESNSKQGIAVTYTNIGNIYKDQGNFEKALVYFNNSLKIKEGTGDKRGIANSYSDIGSVYHDQRLHIKALEHHLNALQLREEIGDQRGLVQACVNLSDIFISNKEFDKALPYLQRGLALTQAIKSEELIAALHTKYALYYNMTTQPAQAFREANRALAIAQTIGHVEQARNAAEQRYIAAAMVGQYRDAFESHRLFISLRDSIQNEKNIRISLSKEFTFKEEKAKIEQEKKELAFATAKERQKLIAYALSGVSVTVIFISILIYRSNRQKHKANRLLTQQKTQIEEVNVELEKLNSVKNRILSIISHDVRGPLNSLKGVLYLLENNAMSPAEFHNIINNVGNQVGQVSDFLDNLLRWTKSQLDQVRPNPEKLSLNFIVEETIELLAMNAKSKQLQISADVPSELAIYADPEMMKLVIRNLLSNAIKFCHENDSIRIHAKPERQMVKVSIEDTGKGISRENIPLLFGLSHLTTKGTKDEIGTGLGLTLCKEFVEISGGRISVTSVEGEGSCFQFTVPMADHSLS